MKQYASPPDIKLAAKNVSPPPAGLTLVYTRSGGNPDGELMTGASFFLQMYNADHGFWEDLSAKNKLTSQPKHGKPLWKAAWNGI